MLRIGLVVACAIVSGCTMTHRSHPSELADLAGPARPAELATLADPRAAESHLYELRPHLEGRIPVVFVHGTASTAGSWQDLVSSLDEDPRIRERFEPWLFTYDSSMPTAHSAGLLRSALSDAVERLDPDGNDAGLHQMVVVGHSQGGLLAKTTSIRSEATLFKALALEEQRGDVASDEAVVEPLPFVRSLIFICTPHRGTLLATLDSMRGFGTHLVSLPLRFMRWSASVFTPGMDVAGFHGMRALRSVENMSPSNEFLRTLAATDVVPEVEMHSIVAVSGNGPVKDGNDGVVRYSSAHLRGVQSELVVRSGHSALNVPGTINEVHRILLSYARRVVHARATRNERSEPPA